MLVFQKGSTVGGSDMKR